MSQDSGQHSCLDGSRREDKVIHVSMDGSQSRPGCAAWNEPAPGRSTPGKQPPANGTPQRTLRATTALTPSCATANVSSPITQTDVYYYLPNGTANLSHIAYNSYGLVTDNKQYNYGFSLGFAPSSSSLVSEIGTTYYPVSNGIANMVESVVVTDWSNGSAVTLASASYTYDGTAVTSTTGTPQHVAVTGARGNLTQATTWTTIRRHFFNKHLLRHGAAECGYGS